MNTGLPEDATKCSPAAEYLFGVWHLSFITGGAEGDRKFRLYHIADLDNGVLKKPFPRLPWKILQPQDTSKSAKHINLAAQKPLVIEIDNGNWQIIF